MPKNGVYFCEVNANDNKYYGVTNIGIKPTIEKKTAQKLSVEVNIFNFNNNIYEKEILISLIKFIRDEIHFENLNQLVNQINIDIENCKKIINCNDK